MQASFVSALDDCLAAISRGESLDACLSRYPRHADQLRAHLTLAQRLIATPRHEPRDLAEAAGWRQFRARAADMRLGRKPPMSINIGWLRPLTIAAALVVALIGAAGGSVYASQDALPDSPLYRVKLATEDVQVWFTFDESAKAQLLLDQSNERTDEIMEMLGDGKTIPGNVLSAMRERNARAVRILEDHPSEKDLITRAHEQSAQQEELLLVLWGDLQDSAQDDYAKAVATLHNAQLRTSGVPGSVNPDDVAEGVINISGAVQPSSEGVWLLGGVEVRLDARTLGETEFEAGQPVRVIAARGANGRLLALSVAPSDGQHPQRQYFVSGTVEDISDNEVVIAGQRIAITENTLLKLKLQRGKKVGINVEDVGGQAVAASVGDEELASPLLAYEGTIESAISTEGLTNDWIVGGQEFTVTPDTEIDARGGTLATGARARVEAILEDGDIVARRVVALPDSADQNAVQVEGLLEKSGKDSWTVSGVEVTAPASADKPEVGSLVTLEGRRKDKQLVTDKLLTTHRPGRGGFALIRGSISRIDLDGTWLVGLLPITVPAEAVIRGEPQAGARVFIWASRDDDDALRAVFINILPH